MSVANIEKLYKNFGILADAKDKISEHTEEYLEIIQAAKGETKEKLLASQFIVRFFKHFPTLSEQAIDALLDLCEDGDVSIRKQAIKDLPTICKDNSTYTHKVSDILAQLLQTSDSTELNVVNSSLLTCIRMDPKGGLGGIFSQILTGEEVVRERCIKFVNVKVKSLGHEVINKDTEDYLITQCKKVLQDVIPEEFHHMISILAWTRLGQTVSGQKELIDLIAEQAELDNGFDPTDTENDHVDRLIQCIKTALPYFSAQVSSQRFVSHICDHVMPVFDKIPMDDLQLEILKLFAELCNHCGALENVESRVEKIYQTLVEYMPLPPETVDGSVPQEEPSLEFSHVECLMYAFHKLGRQCPPDFLTKDPERLKDFKIRLQYFARGIQGYIKKLREALQGKSQIELKSEENKIKVVALKTTSNINIMIKDLFHSPPSFKSVISLSWKPAASASKESESGQKRHSPITYSDSPASKQAKSERSQREIYQPPSGKYSNKVTGYFAPRGGRGGGRSFNRSRFRGNRNYRRNY